MQGKNCPQKFENVRKKLSARFPPLSPKFFHLFIKFILDRYYTKKHEWIELEKHVKGEIGTVGITDFAQQSLGDVVYVELPEVGTKLAKDDTAGAIESVKAASDLYSPMTGEVVELNAEVQDKPQLVNKSCFEKGFSLIFYYKTPTIIDLPRFRIPFL
ncbi:unnamed protein product [Meloidogyne enterolobii]|uniref:Uncharacterized protein n=1 Tax=Meloidogyne enterolobii TaxID=390850 RepID=A0ACB1ALY8_MELEN